MLSVTFKPVVIGPASVRMPVHMLVGSGIVGDEDEELVESGVECVLRCSCDVVESVVLEDVEGLVVGDNISVVLEVVGRGVIVALVASEENEDEELEEELAVESPAYDNFQLEKAKRYDGNLQSRYLSSRRWRCRFLCFVDILSYML